MPTFNNREEYEKWKAEKGELHVPAIKKDSQNSSPPQKSGQLIEVKINDTSLKSSRKKKGKFIVIIGVSILLVASAIFLYAFLKDMSPEKIFALNKKASVFIVTYNLLGEPSGQGSGFILAEDGVVVTNLHVIKNAAALQVKTYDDRILTPIGVLHIDEDNDIALIKIKVKENSEVFKVKVDEPEKLKVGEKIYAIGNPHGLESTFSEGIVSGIREIKSGVKLIQVTAPISPGSSGGPVINRKGKVIGITTFLAEGGQNLNFAYPINVIKAEINVKKIIYTFPDLKANWKFVAGTQASDIPYSNEIGYISSQKVEQFYYDPESIISLDSDIKGFWIRGLSYSRSQAVVLGYSDPSKEHNEAYAYFFFQEMNCNSRRTRPKAFFFINDKQQTVVESDFSDKNTWESWKADSALDKISTVICQP
mgnify:FL=1